jgi:two-component system, NtrC family, sensor kinase
MNDLTGSTILLVDDDEGVRLRWQAIATRMGLNFVGLDDGRRVLDHLQNEPPVHLVVLDVDLGIDLDGPTIAEQILQDNDIPVMFLTASENQATMDRVGRVTHFGVILKNAGSFVIMEAIRMAFRLWKAYLERLEQEYRYRALVESIQDMVLIHNTDGDITYTNDSVQAFARGRSLKHVNDLLGPDYFVRSRLLVQSHGTDKGRAFSFLVAIPDRQGEEHTLDVHSSALFVHGAYSGELVLARDITAQATDARRLQDLNRLLLSIRGVHSVFVNATRPDDLAQQTSDILVRAGAYKSVWIIVDNWVPAGTVFAGAAGAVTSGDELLALRARNTLPCLQLDFPEDTEVLTLRHAPETCRTCPLVAVCNGCAGFSARLRYDGHTFGLMTVTTKHHDPDDGDAAQIFEELATDISFTLFTMWQRQLKQQAEAAAAAHQRRLQSFFETSPMGIITLDNGGRIITSNPYFCSWLGYTEEELLGKNLVSFLKQIPDSFARFLNDTDLTQKRATLTFLRPSGKVIIGEGTVVRIADPVSDTPQIMAVIADVTTRKAAELRLSRVVSELKRSESRYRSLFEDSADGVIITDRSGTIVAINTSAAEMLGYAGPDELIDTSAQDLYDDSAHRQVLLDELDRHGTVKNLEVILKHTDGSRLFGSQSATFVKHPGAKDLLIQSVIRDITERIRSEREATRHSLELSNANEELKKAHEELVRKEKLASIGQLSAGVAHEINNPLGFVRSNFGSLRRYVEKHMAFLEELQTFIQNEHPRQEDPKGLDELWSRAGISDSFQDVTELFEETEDGIQRIIAIVSNLKDFSRAGSNEVMDNYDINRGIQSTLVIARNEYKYVAHIQFEPREVPLITCNANEINQVILTLVVNAAQAINSGGKSDGIISIETTHNGTSLSCSVADNGPGIPDEIRRSIFEPFFTTKKAGVGTGLGLSIAYDIIVNRHGGTMTQKRSPEGGALFTFTIPMTQNKETP